MASPFSVYNNLKIIALEISRFFVPPMQFYPKIALIFYVFREANSPYFPVMS